MAIKFPIRHDLAARHGVSARHGPGASHEVDTEHRGPKVGASNEFAASRADAESGHGFGIKSEIAAGDGAGAGHRAA